jgi:hypothetical protein
MGSFMVALCMALSATAAEVEVRVVREASTDVAGGLYVSHRAPLAPTMFMRLPIGSITPRGWLRHQLELEADGMAGRVPAVSVNVQFDKSAWAEPHRTSGWEELPYWLRGYGDLGYVLKNESIIKQTRKWIDAILAGQEPDGWFGPKGLKDTFDIWPHMPVLNAMQSYYEYSGDRRVLSFMLKYFRWQNGLPPDHLAAAFWAKMRFGDNLESVYWIYDRTGEPWLLELARKIHAVTNDWTHDLADRHGVNIAQCFREPAVFWLQSHEPAFLAAAERNYRSVMDVYGQFPGGGFAADENCRFGCTDPRQGFELCGIVEFMRSFEIMTRISGNPAWADRCEEIAINSLPAALTPDMKAIHYLTGANMVQLDRGNKAPGIENSGTQLSYSPAGIYHCCQHNHAMGWPHYAEELWLATADKGLCASLYAASDVDAKVGNGATIHIAEETDYPFGDTIRLKVSAAKPVGFPLWIRLPRWSGKPIVTINNKPLAIEAVSSGFLVIDRTWADNDTVAVQFPMHIAVHTWKKNKDAVSVSYGPLWFSLKIGEQWRQYGASKSWPEWEVYPTTPWNYGLVLSADAPSSSFTLSRRRGPIAAQPFSPTGSPIELRAKARRIPEWALDRHGLVAVLPSSPVSSSEHEETVTLIPMGAARLRITAFPTVRAAKAPQQ